MIIDVIQTKKDLFAVDFSVAHNNLVIGDASLVGSIGSMEVEGSIRYGNNTVSMSPGKNNDVTVKHCFRPYVFSDGNARTGTIYQTKQSTGFLKSFEYHQLFLEGVFYNIYPIEMGNEGCKTPVYLDNTQIAQINKDCVVINGLHNYRLYASDDFSMYVAIVSAFYMYINAAYEPGKKPIVSKEKVVSYEFSKALKSKYNPDFIKMIDL